MSHTIFNLWESIVNSLRRRPCLFNMPPKNKEVLCKKPPPSVVRPPISESSLMYIPDDVLEGFQERIETGIDWTLTEQAIRHHRRHVYNRENLTALYFTQALENKINHSIVSGFLDKDSNIPLEQHWELLLSITLWDVDKFSTDQGKICFHSANCLTDDLVKLIKTSIRTGDRQVLTKQLKAMEVLRVTDEQMTDLDKSLTDFNRLISLNLCGNCIQNLDATLIPHTVRSLELQANHIVNVGYAEFLPINLLYLGLAKNLLRNTNLDRLSLLPHNLTVLDISDNDIYHLDTVLDALVRLPNLIGLYLAGNPCSVCAGYARLTLMTLRRLEWLDARQILPSDRSDEPFVVHPDDLRSTYFYFTVYRIMSVPPPPKAEKGAITTFHVELEIPLLDVARRRFLFYRCNESLTEMLLPPEDEDDISLLPPHISKSVTGNNVQIEESSSELSDVYQHLVAKSSREIKHFTVFESNKIQWAKVMNFQEPTVKIFCPDLMALRNTFRSVITIRLVYSVVNAKSTKSDKKSTHAVLKTPTEQRVILATVKCALRNPDWSQPSQHFHWDDSLGTKDAIHWGDGDLSVIQYSHVPVKPVKGKQDMDTAPATRQSTPENLTCHFGFGIDTLRVMQ